MKFADIRKMILRETFQKSTEEQDRQDDHAAYIQRSPPAQMPEPGESIGEEFQVPGDHSRRGGRLAEQHAVDHILDRQRPDHIEPGPKERQEK